MQVTMELTAYTATESSQPSHQKLEKVISLTSLL
jgi:hypothetical protein